MSTYRAVRGQQSQTLLFDTVWSQAQAVVQEGGQTVERLHDFAGLHALAAASPRLGSKAVNCRKGNLPLVLLCGLTP